MENIIVLRDSERVESYLNPLTEMIPQLKLLYMNPSEFSSRISNGPLDELVIIEDNILLQGSSSTLNLMNMAKTSFMVLSELNTKHNEVLKVCEKEKRLACFLDSSLSVNIHSPLILSFIKFKKLLGGLDPELLNNLDSVVNMTYTGLKRVKKLHEQLVPLRSEKMKGLGIYSKFAAGFSSGGEFFDFIKKSNKIFMILSNTGSYVISSVLIGHFEKLREMDDISNEDLENFYEEVLDECRSLDLICSDSPFRIQLFSMIIDLSTFTINGHNFGKAKLFDFNSDFNVPIDLPLNENNFEKARFEKQLERGEQLVVASPGLLKNLYKIKQIDDIDKFLNQKTSTPREYLDNIFYELKKDEDSEFLAHDASMIYIEVDQNVIIQV